MTEPETRTQERPYVPSYMPSYEPDELEPETPISTMNNNFENMHIDNDFTGSQRLQAPTGAPQTVAGPVKSGPVKSRGRPRIHPVRTEPKKAVGRPRIRTVEEQKEYRREYLRKYKKEHKQPK